MKEVKVLWEDSKFYSHEWVNTDEIALIDVGDCETMGFLVFENENRIAVAQSINIECETFHNLMIIPRKCIKKIKVLKI